MRYTRALPTNQLMPAASSRKTPDTTAVDVPKRMSGRTLRQPAHRAPHPSSCRRTTAPWTQIRLGAGTPNAVSRTTSSHRRQHMT
jgi:hypothetical protein